MYGVVGFYSIKRIYLLIVNYTIIMAIRLESGKGASFNPLVFRLINIKTRLVLFQVAYSFLWFHLVQLSLE